MRTITYGVDENGAVWSMVGEEVLVPVIDWNAMAPDNNFQVVRNLEKCSALECASALNELRWTRKVPVSIKNQHRQRWGMPALDESREKAQALVLSGLLTDGAHHKQWFLERIFETLGGNLPNLKATANLQGYDWEEGIAL